ncbi:uncharacterized protein [Antedon mediterranea]|uniref:uncharacterized protein n=1 Tax=Antedon mediterranea TaxID=105859 RepID=UPI003AF67D4C
MDRAHALALECQASKSAASRSSCRSIVSIKAQAVANAAAANKTAQFAEKMAKQKADLTAKEAEMEIKKAEARLEEIRREAQQRTEHAKAEAEFKVLEAKQAAAVENARVDAIQQEIQNGYGEIMTTPHQTSNDHALRFRNLTKPQPLMTQTQATTAQSTMPQNQSSSTTDLNALAEAFSSAFSMNRIPAPEPPIFDGDPLKYYDWNASFRCLIENKGISKEDRIHYLKRYIGGPAKEVVSGYFLLQGEHAYENAKAVLEKRYGNPFIVSEAFRDKLDSWPRIQARDYNGLRRLSDFLNQCNIAMREMKGLEVLNDSRENRKILQKLPDWLVNRWRRNAVSAMQIKGSYPTFNDFSTFLTTEAEIVCDPVTLIPENETKFTEKSSRYRNQSQTLATSISGMPSCFMCKMNNHHLIDCRAFARKPDTEKQQYIKQNGLCFSCLQHGHVSRNCNQKSICKICQRRHPTSLHVKERDPANEIDAATQPNVDAKSEVVQSVKTSNVKERDQANEIDAETRLNGDAKSEVVKSVKTSNCKNVRRNTNNTMSSMIVPVWISNEHKPEKEHLVYALLDTQSDTTFVLEDTANQIGASCEPATLRLTTMTSKREVVSCKKYNNLMIRGFFEETKIQLPTAYTREYIPVDQSHIPTPEKTRCYAHLQRISQQIPSRQNCEIGLLIGYNVPQALAPIDHISGNGNEPFAIKTQLGWSVVGGGAETSYVPQDKIGHSHRVMVKEIPNDLHLTYESNLKSEPTKEVHYVLKTAVKEIVTPLDAIRALEYDFTEKVTRDTVLSQEDMQFMDTLKKEVHINEDRHIEMPLPFKKRPVLPNNRICVLHRLNHLKRRFLTNEKYFEDYQKFMTEILQNGDAEKVPANEIQKEPAWYIPHHGIYHPKKPTKIRVVFDCSANYKGTALNQHLLTGPDLNNTLIGVLCRFRQEPIAIMCDIERMFHQFHVNQNDRNYLRFLWWEDGNLERQPIDYRMKVHLFGAASSPGCSNFGLKYMAEHFAEQHKPETVNFIKNNFYVDDGLKSVETVPEAVELIEDARKLTG